MNVVRSLMRTALGRRLPTTRGLIEVAGMADKVIIGRDAFGIAYVEARNDLDAWFGLGFAHGQDRAFQLEGFVRLLRGTLAALIGPDVLPMDRL